MVPIERYAEALDNRDYVLNKPMDQMRSFTYILGSPTLRIRGSKFGADEMLNSKRPQPTSSSSRQFWQERCRTVISDHPITQRRCLGGSRSDAQLKKWRPRIPS
jgi:hypothetical protein